MKIVEVSIENFWDSHTVNYKLDPHVNILIGKNGSGKTHFLKILESVLTGNIAILMDLDFRKATIKYIVNKKTGYIIVEKGRITETKVIRSSGKNKKVDVVTDDLIYIIDGKEFIVSKANRLRWSLEVVDPNRTSPSEIQSRLSDIFKLVILSVDRLNDSIELGGKESKIFAALIETEKREKAFEAIIGSLGNRRVQIKDDLAAVSRETEKKVLETLIFDTENSKISWKAAENYDSEGTKKSFTSFFSDLGFVDDNIQNKINILFEELAELPNLIPDIAEDKNLEIEKLNKFSNLISALSRTDKIMQIYALSEKKKKDVTRDWDKYLESLSSFMSDKNFDFDNEGVFTARSGSKSLKLVELS